MRKEEIIRLKKNIDKLLLDQSLMSISLNFEAKFLDESISPPLAVDFESKFDEDMNWTLTPSKVYISSQKKVSTVYLSNLSHHVLDFEVILFQKKKNK